MRIRTRARNRTAPAERACFAGRIIRARITRAGASAGSPHDAMTTPPRPNTPFSSSALGPPASGLRPTAQRSPSAAPPVHGSRFQCPADPATPAALCGGPVPPFLRSLSVVPSTCWAKHPLGRGRGRGREGCGLPLPMPASTAGTESGEPHLPQQQAIRIGGSEGTKVSIHDRT